MDITVYLVHEPANRHAGPIHAEERLHLQPSEEDLHRRVVGAASLLRHRPEQVVLVAYRYPARPTVVAPAIGMGHGALALAERAACGLEAGDATLYWTIR